MMKYFYMLIVALMATATVNAQNVVLWGNNKDSQFDGGLNGWTAKGISAVTADSAKNALWVWAKDGKATGGAYYGATLFVNSPSLANGTAVFNSDFLETGGTPGTKGKCPGPHKGELTSPKFSIPTTEKELSVTFFQYYRNFQSNCFVSYSMDDGATWSANINLNAGVTVNTVTNLRNQRRNVVLPGAVGSPDFRIRFTFDGRLYFWIIDDVEVIRSSKNNVTANDGWYSINHNRIAPKGLSEPFPVLNDVMNSGKAVAKNVKLNVKIQNEATSAVAYNETLNMNNINSGDTVQNMLFPKLVTLTDVGDYTGTYTVSADSVDQEPSDNTLTFRTTISDSLFAREGLRNRTLRPGDANWAAGIPHSWTIGNTFFVPKGGSKYFASMVQFGLNTPAPLKDKAINVYISKWIDANEDGNAQDSERELVGFADGGYTVKGTEPVSQAAGVAANLNVNTNLNIKVPIRDFAEPSKKLKLQDETTYIVSIEWVAPDDKTNMLLEASDANDYRPSYYGMTQLGKRRVGYQLGIGDNKDWEGDAFGGKTLPCIRLSVASIISGTKEEILLPVSAVQIAPNPAQNDFSVLFNFESTAKNVSMKLVDVTGKIVRTETLENVKSEGYLFNISELAAGTYSLVINSEIGNTVKKVVIIK